MNEKYAFANAWSTCASRTDAVASTVKLALKMPSDSRLPGTSTTWPNVCPCSAYNPTPGLEGSWQPMMACPPTIGSEASGPAMPTPIQPRAAYTTLKWSTLSEQGCWAALAHSKR
jgi:hypothetical protein